MALPANVSYCKITGQFIRAVLDGTDPDRVPDGIPVADLQIVISAARKVVKNLSVPVTIYIDDITLLTDENGFVTDADGVQNINIVANDDPDLTPQGWNYSATISAPTGDGALEEITFSFDAPSGGSVDLTTVIRVPENPGAEVPAWQTAVAATAANVAAAQQIVDDLVNAGFTWEPDGTVDVNLVLDPIITSLAHYSPRFVQMTGTKVTISDLPNFPTGLEMLPSGNAANFVSPFYTPGTVLRKFSVWAKIPVGVTHRVVLYKVPVENGPYDTFSYANMVGTGQWKVYTHQHLGGNQFGIEYQAGTIAVASRYTGFTLSETLTTPIHGAIPDDPRTGRGFAYDNLGTVGASLSTRTAYILTEHHSPDGGAGGVLSGDYPNPGFNTTAVDNFIAGRLDAEESASRVVLDSRVAAAIAALVSSSPELLNTLDELSAALGDDPNFATTVLGQIAAVAAQIVPASTTVAGMVKRTTLAAEAFGFAPTNTGAANQVALQAAVDAAVDQGLDLELAKGVFEVGGRVNVPAPGGVRIFGQGMMHTRIHSAKPSRVFNVSGENVTIADMTFIGDGLDMTGTTKIDYQNYCGVRVLPGAHGFTGQNLHGKDMYITVRVGGDHNGDPEVPLLQAPVERFTVDNIGANLCWAAVFGGTIKDSQINNVWGTYKKAFKTGTGPEVGPPPHLVYLYSPDIHEGAPDIYDPTLRCSNIQVTNCSAYGTPSLESGYAAYALKDIDGLSADNLTARGCPGLLDLIELQDCVITNAVAVDDMYPVAADATRAAVAIKDSRRVSASGKITKALGSEGRAVFMEASAFDCTFDFDVVAKHTIENLVGGNADVRIAGYRNTWLGSVSNAGPAGYYAGVIAVGTGASGRIINPRVSGKYQRSIRIEPTHVGVLLDYDPVLIQPDYSVASTVPLSIGAGSVLIPRDRSKGQAVPGATDNFERPNALGLGVTQDGKLWTPYVSAGGGRHQIVNGRAVSAGVTGALYEVVDSGLPTFVLTAVIGAIGDSYGGLVFRYQDTVNLLFLQTRAGSEFVYRLGKRVANTVTYLGSTTGRAPVVGDVVKVTGAGTTVTVNVNGTDLLTATIAEFAAATQHGLYGQPGSNVSWDSFQVA